MARARLAMPVITSGLACAKCRATLDPLGLRSHTCPGQTRRRRDVVERALREEWSHYGPVSYTHLTLPTICSV
eukprot:396748-Alexandrium_andersonii.AAC.1